MRKIALIFLLFTITQFGMVAYAQEDATEEAETVRETVRQKILSASNKPRAYIGTITDILETTIQLENSEGSIEQVTYGVESTAFVNINGESKEVEFEDVGIGDYIVALGYVDSSEVLSSSRVLITTPLAESDRQILHGEVASIEKKEVTLVVNNEQMVVAFPARWKGPEIEDFDIGSDIIVVVTPNDDDELEVRTLEIIAGSEA